MIQRMVLGIATLLALAVLVLASGLAWAHYAIRQERRPLPGVNPILAGGAQNGPQRVYYINTASQEMPRSAVLDPQADPWPHESYVMSHPSFVIEWADGRLMLVDAGMTRAGAQEFGKPIELMASGQPIRAHASVAERLGDARTRLAAAVFTHLHADHVGGIHELCAVSQPITVFMTPAQIERPNYTTRPGWKLLRESPCVQPRALGSEPLVAIPGFPGVYVVAAGGHTPGSQIVVVHLADGDKFRRIAFVGDIANHIDGITYNVPKPFLYSLLVVPEDRVRLEELRRWLRTLRDSHGIELIVAHDQLALERSRIPLWAGP
jgi:glyoxylase-like metal-dependent hydrolase (beta-lactamase superfamily II)